MTSLGKALTGVDTDRLKEEKARGISIELGYAYKPLAGGVVLFDRDVADDASGPLIGVAVLLFLAGIMENRARRRGDRGAPDQGILARI